MVRSVASRCCGLLEVSVQEFLMPGNDPRWRATRDAAAARNRAPSATPGVDLRSLTFETHLQATINGVAAAALIWPPIRLHQILFEGSIPHQGSIESGEIKLSRAVAEAAVSLLYGWEGEACTLFSIDFASAARGKRGFPTQKRPPTCFNRPTKPWKPLRSASPS